jgi:hypothetical protein
MTLLVHLLALACLVATTIALNNGVGFVKKILISSLETNHFLVNVLFFFLWLDFIVAKVKSGNGYGFCVSSNQKENKRNMSTEMT